MGVEMESDVSPGNGLDVAIRIAEEKQQMIYDKQNAPKKIRELQRWVNNKFIFRSCERFEDYKKVTA